jgi:hypothetical protein
MKVEKIGGYGVINTTVLGDQQFILDRVSLNPDLALNSIHGTTYTIWLVVDQQAEISTWLIIPGAIAVGPLLTHIITSHLESQVKVQAQVAWCLPVAICAAMACSVV